MRTFIGKVRDFLFKSKKRAIITLIVVVLLIFAAGRVFGAKKPQATYQTATVERGTLVVSVSESGQIVSTGELPVQTLASGIVGNVYVKNGDTVTKGQKIMDIIPDQSTTQALAQASANYQQAQDAYNSAVAGKTAAQAALEKDRATVITASSNENIAVNKASAKQNNPATGSLYTQNDLDVIESTLTSARETFSADEKKYLSADTAIAAASSSLASAQQSYQQLTTTVTAPTDGTIENLAYAPGIGISAGSLSVSTGTGSNSSSSSRSLNTIAQIQTSADTKPAATFNLSEVDAPKVQQGQHATLTLDAFPDKTFTGTVIGVNREGAVSSGVTNYPVTVQLDSGYENMSPNMSATANIIIDTKTDVLLVPSAAVQTSNGQSTVRVLKNGKISAVDVTVGESSDTQTEITSGLNEGDTVVIGGLTQSNTSSPFSRNLFGGFGGGGRGGGGGTVIRTGGGGGAVKGG
jgi:macrolide-specific efflux system membrane fusion protein